MDYDIGDINITDILNITSAANFYQVEYFGNLELTGANSTDDIHVCCLSDMTLRLTLLGALVCLYRAQEF